MERLTVADEKLENGKKRVHIIDVRAVKECAMKFYWRLKEYEDAEENGLLKKLPCRVGDTVYVITACQHIHEVLDGNWETATGYYCPYELYDRCPHECEECDEVQEKPMVFEDEVSCIHIDECGIHIICKLTNMFGLLNDDIFLTMKEAQKALKERELKCKNL